MKEIIATITSKGQVTVPAEIRRRLGLKQGDRVAFVLTDQGGVELQHPRFPDVASLQGAAGMLGRPLTWEEIEQTVADERAEAYRARFTVPRHE